MTDSRTAIPPITPPTMGPIWTLARGLGRDGKGVIDTEEPEGGVGIVGCGDGPGEVRVVVITEVG